MALRLHVWLVAGGRRCSALDTVTASQQLLEITSPLLWVLHVLLFNGAISFLEGGRAGNGVVNITDICFNRWELTVA